MTFFFNVLDGHPLFKWYDVVPFNQKRVSLPLHHLTTQTTEIMTGILIAIMTNIIETLLKNQIAGF